MSKNNSKEQEEIENKVNRERVEELPSNTTFSYPINLNRRDNEPPVKTHFPSYSPYL